MFQYTQQILNEKKHQLIVRGSKIMLDKRDPNYQTKRKEVTFLKYHIKELENAMKKLNQEDY